MLSRDGIIFAAHAGGVNDDVLQIRLEDKTLIAQYADGEQAVVLDDAYQLGTPYNLTIDASDSKVVVFYNGQQKADLPLAGDGWSGKSALTFNPTPSAAPILAQSVKLSCIRCASRTRRT